MILMDWSGESFDVEVRNHNHGNLKVVNDKDYQS
jgi:hypothetical protein